MNQEERTKLHIAHCLIEGKMTICEAAELLGLCERQVKRIKKGVKENGDAFLIHKNRGQSPQHAISDEVKNSVVALKNSEKYSRANFSHFQELLDANESISLSKPSVYRILVAGGITSPKKHSRQKLHKRRKRKPQRGMLAVIDASPHRWFFDDREFSLHGAVDDATSEILALFFTPNECLEGYFEVVRTIALNHGLPLALYADRHTIFRSPNAGKLSIEDELKGIKVNDTQFGAALRTLGVNLIYAKSPQAKGRIERLWETLQSRLPVELDIAGIKNPEDANAFLADFIKRYNQRFAVTPKIAESAFRQLDDHLSLDHILCVRETRQADHGSAFSFENSFYRVLRNGKPMPILPKAKLTVLKSSRIGLKAEYSGSIYDVERLDERPKTEPVSKNKSNQKTKPVPPAKEHPWRKPSVPMASSLMDESDREILEALYSSRLAWR